MSRDLDLSFLNTNKLLNTGDYDVDENKIIDKAEAIHSDTPIDENTFYGMKNGELGFHEVESGLSGDFVFTNPQDGEVISFDEGKWVNVELDISYSSLSDKPTLSTVATSGSYLDLSNIPVEFAPSQHGHAHSEITGLGTIATYDRGTAEGQVLVVGDIPNTLGNSETLPATQKAIKDVIDTKVSEAPEDGKQYIRKDGSWVETAETYRYEFISTANQTTFECPESIEDKFVLVHLNGTLLLEQHYSISGTTVTFDAPLEVDDVVLVLVIGESREVIIEGVPEAPIDGKQYARKDGAWVAIEKPDGVKVWVADSEWFDDPDDPVPGVDLFSYKFEVGYDTEYDYYGVAEGSPYGDYGTFIENVENNKLGKLLSVEWTYNPDSEYYGIFCLTEGSDYILTNVNNIELIFKDLNGAFLSVTVTPEDIHEMTENGSSYIALEVTLTEEQFNLLPTSGIVSVDIVLDTDGEVFIPEPEGDFLTFSSDSPFSISFPNKNWDGVLEYSTDTVNWTEWDANEISSVNNALYLRGSGNTVITGMEALDSDSPSDYAIQIDASSSIECSGNIMTLLDYENADNAVMGEGAFLGLFADCTSLTAAPELPATTLAHECYSYMFADCTGLTVAPELPATTLAEGCYSSMFFGCTNLTVAPELPATTLAEYCYSTMFFGCTNLTVAPELPATTLAEGCYGAMFYGCTSLLVAPELPATTLVGWCYSGMFADCTSLTVAPELPVTLAEGCYFGMFDGCTSLTTAPELPVTTLADRCYYDMFRNCSSLVVAPELPATTLDFQCYRSMFEGCTSLTAAPELPATTLAHECYSYMFKDCTNIKISETQTGIYQKPWRIPTVGEGTIDNLIFDWGFEILRGTGGTFTDRPTINTTYYQAG